MSELPARYTSAMMPSAPGLDNLAAALVEGYDRADPPRHPVPQEGAEPEPWFAAWSERTRAVRGGQARAAAAPSAGLDEEIASGYAGLIALHLARAQSPGQEAQCALWHRARAGRLADLAPLPGFAEGTPC